MGIIIPVLTCFVRLPLKAIRNVGGKIDVYIHTCTYIIFKSCIRTRKEEEKDLIIY